MSQKSPEKKKKRDAVYFKFRYPSLKFHETETCQRLDYEIEKQCVMYKDFTIDRGRNKKDNDQKLCIFLYTPQQSHI